MMKTIIGIATNPEAKARIEEWEHDQHARGVVIVQIIPAFNVNATQMLAFLDNHYILDRPGDGFIFDPFFLDNPGGKKLIEDLKVRDFEVYSAAVQGRWWERSVKDGQSNDASELNASPIQKDEILACGKDSQDPVRDRVFFTQDQSTETRNNSMKSSATNTPQFDIGSLLLCMLECQAGQLPKPGAEQADITIDPTSLILCLITCGAEQAAQGGGTARARKSADSPERAQNLAVIRSLLDIHVQQQSQKTAAAE